jgi:uncharacterized OB-fold protein
VTTTSNVNPPRPHPYPDEVTAGYWAAVQKRTLAIQQCGDCGTFIHYPSALCTNCQSENLDYSTVSGRGIVYSFAIVRHSFHPAFTPPYVIALIDLDDAPGVRMYTNIVDVDPETVRIDMPVQVSFEDIGGGILIPQFIPA